MAPWWTRAQSCSPTSFLSVDRENKHVTKYQTPFSAVSIALHHSGGSGCSQFVEEPDREVDLLQLEAVLGWSCNAMETTYSERLYNIILYFAVSLTILGLKGGFSSLRSSLSHSMDLKNKCALMSSAPVLGWHPSRCPGCLCKNWEDTHITLHVQ